MRIVKTANIILGAILLALYSCKPTAHPQAVDTPPNEVPVLAPIQPRPTATDISKPDEETATKFIETLSSQDLRDVQNVIKGAGSLAMLNIQFGESRPQQSSLLMAEYLADSYVKRTSSEGRPLKFDHYQNDNDEKFIKVSNDDLSYKLNVTTQFLSDLSIKSPNVNLVGKQITIRVGDQINAVKKYYNKAFNSKKRITKEGKSYESVLLPSSDFTEVKSDQYIYVDFDSSGRIVEIGSWEQH